MEFNGYKRTKKNDVKKWLSGGNTVLYLIVLVLFVAALLFALYGVIGMKNSTNTDQDESVQETEPVSEQYSVPTTTFVATNQTYNIKISIDKKTLVVYQTDVATNETKAVRAFLVALPEDIKPLTATITEKTIWKSVGNSYVRYVSRLDNAEFFSSAAYYSQNIYNLNPNSYNKIGKSASDCSIIMTVTDAKWIYENCGENTPVEILRDFEVPSGIAVEPIKPLPADAFRDPIDEGTYIY